MGFMCFKASKNTCLSSGHVREQSTTLRVHGTASTRSCGGVPAVCKGPANQISVVLADSEEKVPVYQIFVCICVHRRAKVTYGWSAERLFFM